MDDQQREVVGRAALHPGDQVDVAARRKRNVVALDQRHRVGQVLKRGKIDDAGLVDDVGGGHDGKSRAPIVPLLLMSPSAASLTSRPAIRVPSPFKSP